MVFNMYVCMYVPVYVTLRNVIVTPIRVKNQSTSHNTISLMKKLLVCTISRVAEQFSMRI
jgi:hypothetical protein